MKSILISGLLLCISGLILGQQSDIGTLRTTDSLSLETIDFSKRKRVVLATGIGSYTAMATGLYFAWYNKFDQSAFHSFDDWGEWMQMDKAGHVYSAYLQSDLVYGISKWAGYSDHQALKLSTISSLAGQLGIEIMDGFSTEWGFSWGDIGSNLLGTSLFYFQEKHWGKQVFRMKMSYWPVDYSRTPLASSTGEPFSSLQLRSESIFGQNGVERFLKDYNGQTIWISASLYHFFPEIKMPKWLALSFGYSGQYLYGARSNQWVDNGHVFNVDIPRSRQFILALDYNLSHIKTKRPFIKSLLRFANIFKWPAPALSYSTSEGFLFHIVFRN